jgi:hypothetical protein
MKPILALAASIAATLAAASGAQATTVVDFNELAHSLPVKIYNAPIVSKGFSFTSEVPTNGIGVWGTINNAEPGGATITNWSSKIITVRRTDGEFFSLESMDIADTYNAGGATELLFTFFDGAALSTQTIVLDRLRGMQTFDFDRSRVEWFSYAQVGSGGAQSDNFVFGEAAQAAVPEPATWALMILGFGSAGAMLRRRHGAALAA